MTAPSPPSLAKGDISDAVMTIAKGFCSIVLLLYAMLATMNTPVRRTAGPGRAVTDAIREVIFKTEPMKMTPVNKAAEKPIMPDFPSLSIRSFFP